jgi:hypothetical protein
MTASIPVSIRDSRRMLRRATTVRMQGPETPVLRMKAFPGTKTGSRKSTTPPWWRERQTS